MLRPVGSIFLAGVPPDCSVFLAGVDALDPVPVFDFRFPATMPTNWSMLMSSFLFVLLPGLPVLGWVDFVAPS